MLDDPELFLIPALIFLILAYHAGRILYRELKSGYEDELSGDQ